MGGLCVFLHVVLLHVAQLMHVQITLNVLIDDSLNTKNHHLFIHTKERPFKTLYQMPKGFKSSNCLKKKKWLHWLCLRWSSSELMLSHSCVAQIASARMTRRFRDDWGRVYWFRGERSLCWAYPWSTSNKNTWKRMLWIVWCSKSCTCTLVERF